LLWLAGIGSLLIIMSTKTNALSLLLDVLTRGRYITWGDAEAFVLQFTPTGVQLPGICFQDEDSG
jgi:hypothetical protein